MILRFSLVFLALLLAPCLLCAQSFSVNAPFDSNTYKPLNGPERWQRWYTEDGAGGAIHVQSLATAAYFQAIADPTAWSRSTGGFIRRVGSSYGSNLIQNSIHEGMASAAGTDPRYFACSCSGFFHRTGHALQMTFFTYDRSGHETLDVPQISGVYGSSMIEAMWYPHHYTALVQGVQSGHIEMGLVGAVHLAQEFSPEVKRWLHLRPGAANDKP